MEQNIYKDDMSVKALLKYAVVYPLGLIAACMLAELLNK